jgi:hypothetical protein
MRLQHVVLKVSLKEQERTNVGDDEDFWKQELKQMQRQGQFAPEREMASSHGILKPMKRAGAVLLRAGGPPSRPPLQKQQMKLATSTGPRSVRGRGSVAYA